MITTVIFDLDGLLADTEKLHRKAYQVVLARLGVEVSDEYYEEHWIRAGRGITQFLKERGLGFDADEIRREKARVYRQIVLKSARAMPGALALLELLKGKKKVALATSSYADAADAVMTALDIRKYFKFVATSENVLRVKPHPALFRCVAKRLKVSPRSCVVLEDSEKGVFAAHAAGMKCIAVPNTHTRGHDFSKATLVVPSLKDVTLELIDSLWETGAMNTKMRRSPPRSSDW